MSVLSQHGRGHAQSPDVVGCFKICVGLEVERVRVCSVCGVVCVSSVSCSSCCLADVGSLMAGTCGMCQGDVSDEPSARSLVHAEGLLISLRHDLPWLPVVGNLARNRVSTEGSAEKKDVRLGPAGQGRSGQSTRQSRTKLGGQQTGFQLRHNRKTQVHLAAREPRAAQKLKTEQGNQFARGMTLKKVGTHLCTA